MGPRSAPGGVRPGQVALNSTCGSSKYPQLLLLPSSFFPLPSSFPARKGEVGMRRRILEGVGVEARSARSSMAPERRRVARAVPGRCDAAVAPDRRSHATAVLGRRRFAAAALGRRSDAAGAPGRRRDAVAAPGRRRGAAAAPGRRRKAVPMLRAAISTCEKGAEPEQALHAAAECQAGCHQLRRLLCA